MGRHEQAIAEQRRARELDPLALIQTASLGYALYLARQYEPAVEQLKNTLEIDNNYGFSIAILAYTYDAMGHYNEAISQYQAHLRLAGDNASDQCYLGYSLAKAGRRNEAETILKKLETSTEYVSPAELAVLYLGLGDKEKALLALQHAYAAHDLQMVHLGVDPHYDPLRSEPRFQELIRKVGLPG
jgi:adenylate cyclase